MKPPSETRFDALFAPLALGRKTAPNRFVFAAHQTNFATHNRLTERHAAYYAARAAGGAGLIVLEGSIVHPSDWPLSLIHIYFIPSLGSALLGIEMVAQNLRRAVYEPLNYEARLNMMYASYISAQAFNSGGLGIIHSICLLYTSRCV